MFLLNNLNNMKIFVLGVVGPKMAMDFGSKEVEPRLMRGMSMDSPRTIFGTVKISPDLCVGPKNVHVNFLKINGLNCVENNMLMHEI